MGAGDENKTGTSEPSFGHDRLKSSMGISLMLLLSQNQIDICLFFLPLYGSLDVWFSEFFRV